jgi:hypothetical protein
MSRWCALAGVLAFLACRPVLAQRAITPSQPAAAIRAASVRSALQQMLSPSQITVPDQGALPRDTHAQEIRLVWATAQAASATQAAGGLRVVSRAHDPGTFPRQRSLDLAEDRLFVAAIDAGGVLRGWSVIPDPRFVRSEVPGPDGVLTGQIVPVARPEFLVLIPDDPDVVEIRIFQPRRSGDAFTLELVATLAVQASSPSGDE